MEVIRNVGPGGNFLTEDHTLNNFKQYLHFSDLLNRDDYDNWKRGGSVDFGKKANTKVRHILESRRAPELPPEIVLRVREVVQKREKK
jgi:trimethylamine--corrinoid protein Co-methyltransferase